MSSYDEHLISQAGGDGDASGARIRMWVLGPDETKSEFMQFTNVPMERVHAAIALLNGDMHDATGFGHIGRYQDGVWIPLEFPEPVEPGHIRTEDFTVAELFPNPNQVRKDCQECGAWIPAKNVVKHVTWHNKLLP